MAKIYETRQDVERDELANRARETRKSASQLLWLGVLSGVMGFVNRELENLRNFKAETLKKPRSGFSKGAGKLNTYLFYAIGAVGLVTSFWARSKIKEDEKKLDALGGPVRIIEPGDAPGEVLLSSNLPTSELQGKVVTHVSRLMEEELAPTQKTLH